MPAVANALVDALSEFGVRHIEMPATPEVVWRAMRNGKGLKKGGSPGRIRTSDQPVNSRLLYR